MDKEYVVESVQVQEQTLQEQRVNDIKNLLIHSCPARQKQDSNAHRLTKCQQVAGFLGFPSQP